MYICVYDICGIYTLHIYDTHTLPRLGSKSHSGLGSGSDVLSSPNLECQNQQVKQITYKPYIYIYTQQKHTTTNIC